MSGEGTSADLPCCICGKEADHNTPTCCSSHEKVLCHACYRRSHFVEVCSCRKCRVAPSVPVLGGDA